MGPPPVQRGFFHQWGWKKAGMAARKAEEKRRGHRAAVPPARPMRRHRPREGGKRSIGRERLPDSHVPPSPMLPTESSVQVRTIQGLPHVRGGVSFISAGPPCGWKSSPRAWGCFASKSMALNCEKGFPTRVGVFPDPAFRESFRPGFPHARGGVSKCHSHPRSHLPSSPRTWGCFLQRQGG